MSNSAKKRNYVVNLSDRKRRSVIQTYHSDENKEDK